MGRSPGHGVSGSCVLNRVSFSIGSREPYMWVPTISEWEMKNKEDREKNTDHK